MRLNTGQNCVVESIYEEQKAKSFQHAGGLSSWRSGFAPSEIDMGIVVDRVGLEEDLVPVL